MKKSNFSKTTVVVFCVLFVCSVLRAGNIEIIENSINTVWQRRGEFGEKIAQAVRQGRLPLVGMASDIQDLDARDLLGQLSDLANTGLIGLEEMNAAEKALWKEVESRKYKGAAAAVTVIRECGLKDIARDEVIIRIIAPRGLASPSDLPTVWNALSEPTRLAGVCYIRELFYGILVKKLGRPLSFAEIETAFPRASVFRDGLVLGVITSGEWPPEDKWRKLLTLGASEAFDRTRSGSPVRMALEFAKQARLVPGGGYCFVRRLRAGPYTTMIKGRDDALVLLNLWASLRNVHLGQAEQELFAKWIEPRLLKDLAGDDLKTQLTWIASNVPSNVPRNSYLFALVAAFAKKSEHIAVIIPRMQRRLDEDSRIYLELVLEEGARLRAAERGGDFLENALNFIEEVIPAEKEKLSKGDFELRLPVMRVRDDVVLSVMNTYGTGPEDVERTLPFLHTPKARAEAGELGYGLALYALPEELDARLTALVRFFPEPSRVRDKYLGHLMDKYCRDGDDVAKIRHYQFSAMSEEERGKGAYGRTVQAATAFIAQVAERSTLMEKALALVAYVRSLLGKGAGHSGDVSSPLSQLFSFNDDLDPLDRKEVVRSLLVGDKGILADEKAERAILQELFNGQVNIKGKEKELLQNLIEGYIFRLSKRRKIRIFLALLDMAGRKLSAPEMIRQMVEKLGVVPVKFAQMLASRDDVLTPSYKKELEGLCDDVASFDRGTAIEIIESVTGTSIREISDDGLGKQIGSGSVKQVYRITHHGHDAVVKVIRPGAREEVEEDLAILHELTRSLVGDPLIEQYVKDPEVMITQFERELRLEMDSANEAANVKHFREIFADDPDLTAPKVMLLDGDVMIEEFIKGAKVTEAPAKFGLDPRQLAERIVRGMMVQIFRDGFFHGDPHPGNVMVTKDGTIVFIDWGMTGRLPLGQRLNLVKLFLAMLAKRPKMVFRRLADMDKNSGGTLTPQAEQVLIEDIERILTQPKRNGQQRKAGEKLLGLLYKGAQSGLDLPPDFTMMGKAIMCIEGTARQLDPDIQVVPYIAKAFLQAYVHRIKEVVRKPFEWLSKRFNRKTIQHLRALADDEDTTELLARALD